MKTITLPDGRKAHFPDTATPETINAAIEKHGTKPKPMFMIMHDHDNAKERKARDDSREMAHSKRHQETLSRMDSHNQKTTSAMVSHAKATESVANGVNRGLDALIKVMIHNAGLIDQLGTKIDMLSKSVQQINGLSKCVDNLAAELGKSTSMLVKTMKAPRKITHSTRGRPIGMQIGDE